MVTESEQIMINNETKKNIEVGELEFENLVLKNIPRWTAVWNMLLQEGKEMRKNPSGGLQSADLEKRIRNKISDLVRKEEVLVELYKKAAEVSKKKEEEFKGKIAILMTQIQKDKNLLKILTHTN